MSSWFSLKKSPGRLELGVVPTGKSISVLVAFVVRACEAACRRVRDNGSLGARPKNWKFPGVVPGLAGTAPLRR